MRMNESRAQGNASPVQGDLQSRNRRMTAAAERSSYHHSSGRPASVRRRRTIASGGWRSTWRPAQSTRPNLAMCSARSRRTASASRGAAAALSITVTQATRARWSGSCPTTRRAASRRCAGKASVSGSRARAATGSRVFSRPELPAGVCRRVRIVPCMQPTGSCIGIAHAARPPAACSAYPGGWSGVTTSGTAWTRLAACASGDGGRAAAGCAARGPGVRRRLGLL